LRDNCDEFIYYEDLETVPADVPNLDPQVPEVKRKAFTLLVEALTALRRENKERLWSSMIKDTMKRLKPSFNETYHGYRTFSALLEDAQTQGILALETDDRSGTYVVTSFGEEKLASPPPARRRRRRRSRRRGAGGPSGNREREGVETPAENGSTPAPADNLPPETFDDEFIPWPEE
jgi:hypothetical protein